jgi:signal transduction histidine kinase/CheY-like chemotaxis protein
VTAKARVPVRRSVSLKSSLLLCAVGIVLPLLLFFGALSLFEVRSERERASQRLLDLARGMAQAVDLELQARILALQSLALSPPLQAGDIEAFRPHAEAFLSLMPSAALGLVERSGNLLLQTGRGVPPPKPGTIVVSPDLVERVFLTGQPVITDLYKTVLQGRLGFSVNVPVFRGGQVAYSLRLNPFTEGMTRIIERQQPPAGWVFSVFDSSGVNVARVPNPERFVGQLAAPSLLPSLLAAPEGVISSTSLEGVPLRVAWSRVGSSGWSVGIGVPQSELSVPFWQALEWTLAVGTLALLLSAVLATALARRVLRPIGALVGLASEQDGAAGPVNLGLHEANVVGDALRAAAVARAKATQKLRDMNETLEAQVGREVAVREQAQGRLAQAQRLEALGQLAGGIAHDFNNVLQAVSGGLTLIGRRAGDAEMVRKLARMAGDATDRGAAITGRLLSFSRKGALHAEPVPAGPLLEGMREIFAATLSAGIETRIAMDGALPPLLADKAQLETVLVNLAVNARDAMPNGGCLTLHAAAETVGDAHRHHAGLAAGGYVRLDVADTGTGMDAATLMRAGEPFFTTKTVGQGTGLGLAMARGFAQQSGGGFAIRSVSGKGTTISLWFPRASAGTPDVGIGAVGQPRAVMPGPARHILVVDDDAMVRAVLVGQLEDLGYVVIQAGDGLEALARLDAGAETDLLVTDFAMPGMNGGVLIGEVRRRLPALPALLLTGYANLELQSSVERELDVRTVLLRKPVSGAELAERVAALLDSQDTGRV